MAEGMPETVEDMVREILRLIDESGDYWKKATFYSDPEVCALLDELYQRWEANERRGMPLDYASEEEVYFLYRKAASISDEIVEMKKREFVNRSMAKNEGGGRGGRRRKGFFKLFA